MDGGVPQRPRAHTAAVARAGEAERARESSSGSAFWRRSSPASLHSRPGAGSSALPLLPVESWRFARTCASRRLRARAFRSSGERGSRDARAPCFGGVAGGAARGEAGAAGRGGTAPLVEEPLAEEPGWICWWPSRFSLFWRVRWKMRSASDAETGYTVSEPS